MKKKDAAYILVRAVLQREAKPEDERERGEASEGKERKGRGNGVSDPEHRGLEVFTRSVPCRLGPSSILCFTPCPAPLWPAGFSSFSEEHFWPR